MAENLVRNRLMDQRRALLDLGTRNRLINVPLRVKGVRTVEIVDEKSPDIYRALIEGRGMTFLPGRIVAEGATAGQDEDDRETWSIAQPRERAPDEKDAFRRHADIRLQTRLTSEGLQKRLFDLWYDARTLEEEQGVNVLFLGIGLLRWFEDERSDVARHAPLILLPVQLERGGASERFRVLARGEPASPNLSLQAKLQDEFGLVIEDFADEEEVDIATYLARVAAAVAGKPRWKVLPDAMVLGLFSFSRLVTYRDLDPENWPKGSPLHEHAVVAALLGNGFDRQDPIVGDDEPIDGVIPPAALNHVVDADASQAVAIEEAMRGRHLVIRGAPGTGKSQTITNIIAGAVLQGKKVLFVAEKATALEVVQRRLRQVGLGPMTLELHSGKANKRAILDDLRRTREISNRAAPQDFSLIEHMGDAQAELNNHAAMLHEPLQPSGLTSYQLLGRLLSVQDGGGLPGFTLDGAAAWTAQEARKRFDLAAELAGRLGGVGDAGGLAWRGVGRVAFDPGDRDRLTSLLHNVEADIETVGRTAAAVSRDFDVEIHKIGDFETLARAMKATLSLPAQVDRSALAGPIWRKSATQIAEIVPLGRSYRKFLDAMALVYRTEAWRFDVRLLRNEIAAQSGTWSRFLNGPYREAMEQFRSLLVIDVPADRAKQISLLDGMISAQETRRRFETQSRLGAEAFGTLWLGEQSDWDSLQAVVDWWRDNRQAASSDSLAARLAVRPQGRDRGASGSPLAQSVPRLFADLGQLQQFLLLDLNQAFGVDNWTDLAVDQLTSRLQLWLAGIESLIRWISFGERCRFAREAGLGALVDRLCDGSIAGNLFVPTVQRAYYEGLHDEFFQRMPGLRSFDGELQELMVESFRVLDYGRIALARETIATRHLQARPAGDGNAGALGVLGGEFAKRRGHLPIRQLMEKAGPAIQQLKPVMMMSPLSVGLFLKPGALAFDLVVIDEASQIEPLDAFGAIARAKQAVVVGDELQLPPTRAFARLSGDGDEQDDEEGATLQAADAQSLLDLCLARGMPARTLHWHYRSKHQSLIAMSNHEFYGDRLMVVPSPHRKSSGVGLAFRHLPHALYDRGNTRTNLQEAKAVAEAVIAHAGKHSQYRDTLSLGVVTFSVAQRQAILRELELLRRAHPETESFFNSDSIEPFFVKNLENVQGDERDLIFISVGYGRNAEGYLAMNFGPLNRNGGERRLNVLASRARYRCEVFSSITGDDIDADRAGARGVAALKTFLDFARSGGSNDRAEAEGGPDFLFDEQVASQLRARGHTVTTRIGDAGFRVDLAVTDPDAPERYVLGIECDGVPYNAARSARDRDRLRQQVLESQGWIIHRIWSVDWYQRPQEELAKVEAAIITARLAWQQRDDDLASPSVLLEPISSFEPEAIEVPSASEVSVFAEPPPVEAELAGPQAIEPASAEAATAEPVVLLPEVQEPTPSQHKSSEDKPSENKPNAAQSSESVPPLSSPNQPKVAEPRPIERGPIESRRPLFPFPAFGPIEARPIEARPIEARPLGHRPLHDPSPRPKPLEPEKAEPTAVVSDVAGPVAADLPPPAPVSPEPMLLKPLPDMAAVADADEPGPIEPAPAYPDLITPVPADRRSAESRSTLSQPYVEAVLRVSTRHELQELSAARMAVYVAEVVRVEGPVHEQEIIARIRGAFGLGRAGVRVREAVLDGIDAARITGKISGGPFYMAPGQTIEVRDRSQTTSPGLRKLDMLPPQEIEAAFGVVIRANLGAPRDTLLVAVSRVLGFAATSAPLRERLEEILDAMLVRRELAQRNNLVVAVQ